MFFCNIISRTLPAKHVDKIAEQMRIHNINALLVIGGFEVCNVILTASTCVQIYIAIMNLLLNKYSFAVF